MTKKPERSSLPPSGSATTPSAATKTGSSKLSFWNWLFVGTGARSGLARFVDRWLAFHVAVGLGLAWLTPLSIREAASTVLLPLAGIFIGLTFAWAGNAQALLQASEIEELAEHRRGGFEEYVFTFQLAVFTLLFALVVWGVAALGVLDRPCPWACPPSLYLLTKSGLFAVSSLALRECWHVVVGAQTLLIVRRRIRSSRQGEQE